MQQVSHIRFSPVVFVAAQALVLFACAMYAQRLDYETLLALACLGIPIAAALAFLFRHPAAGLFAVVLSALFAPFVAQSAMGSNLNLTFLLLPALTLVLALSWLRNRTPQAVNRSAVITAAFLFLFAGMVSFAIGQLPWFAASHAPLRAQLGGLALVVFSIVLLLYGSHFLVNERLLARLVAVFLVAGSIRVFLLLLPQNDLIGIPTAGHFPALALPELGSMFWNWFLALAFGQLVINSSLRLWHRMALVVVIVTAIYITFFVWRDWASGWLPAFVSMALIFVLARPRTALALSVPILAAASLKYSQLAAAIMTSDQQYSLATRLQAMQVVSDIISRNPIFGYGPANYYYYTPLFRISGWYVSFSSHNNFVDLLAEFGLLGLCSFLWLVVTLLRHARSSVRRELTLFQRAYVYGCVGALAGSLCSMALGDWLIPFAYNVGISGFKSSCLAWVFLGGLLTVAAGSKQLGNVAPSASPEDAVRLAGPKAV